MTDNDGIEFKGEGIVSYSNGIMRICVVLPGKDGNDVNVWKDVSADDAYIEWLKNRVGI